MVHKFLYWMEGVGFFKSIMYDFNVWNFKRTEKAPSWAKAAYCCIHPSVNLLKDKISKTAFNL